MATVSGEAFYYISQRAERPIAFMPQSVVDQRVIAVYFDKNRRVERLANYGLRDGKVFDYVTRTTPTGGKDVGYLNAVFRLFCRSFAARTAIHDQMLICRQLRSPRSSCDPPGGIVEGSGLLSTYIPERPTGIISTSRSSQMTSVVHAAGKVGVDPYARIDAISEGSAAPLPPSPAFSLPNLELSGRNHGRHWRKI